MAVLMIGVLWTSHIDNGFFMNWFGNQKGEGFEFDLLAIGLGLGILFNGGKYSLDYFIGRYSSKAHLQSV